MPAYGFLLAATSVIALVLFLPRDFETFIGSLQSAAYFTSNRFFAAQADYFAPSSHELPLLHTWSLAIEAQFYLLFPLLYLIPSKRWRATLMVLVAMALLGRSALKLNEGNHQAEYFALYGRIPEFLAGALAAMVPNTNLGARGVQSWRGGLGLMLILGSAFLLNEETAFPGVNALPLVLGAVMMICSPQGRVNAMLKHPVFLSVGNISYSLYLWHWPVLSFWRYWNGVYHIQLLPLVCLLIIILLLSFASYAWIEKPFRSRSGIGLSGWSLASAILAAVTVGAVVSKSHIAPPLPIEWSRYADPTTICHGQIVGDCVRGLQNAPREILLLGDSHAAQLNLAASAMGNAAKARIRVISASSCVPVEGFDVDRLPYWAQKPCRQAIEQANTYLSKADAVIVAGMWTYQVESPRFLSAFAAFLDQVHSRGLPVMVLGQIPKFEQNPLRVHRFAQVGLPTPEMIRDPALEKSNSVIRGLAHAHGEAFFVEVGTLRMFRNAPYLNGALIYHDSHHLNEVGAREFGNEVGPLVASWTYRVFR